MFLRILSRRPDGYHNLASLFQALDLCDTLHFKITTDKDSLICTDPKIPTDHSNLIFKAANIFRKMTGMNFNLQVHLEKKIPSEAGLGGGSSNAATTLWALNELNNTRIPTEILSQWGAEIGSDVPFFLSTGTAYCTGRGEILQQLPSLLRKQLWIIKPEKGLSTPLVYKNLKLDKLHTRDPELTLKNFLAGKPEYYNDLEEPAIAVMPELAKIKQKLLQHEYEAVLLSGSGSGIICVGVKPPPFMPDVKYFMVNFLNRKADGWYVA